VNESPFPLPPGFSPASFVELDRVLDQVGAMTGPAECHGLIAGYLCAKKDFDTSDELLSVLDLPESAGREMLVIERLADETFRQLESEDCIFQPLLPDETEPLETRAAALGEWCHGFLLGLGFSGLRDQEMHSPEGHEFIRDLTAFTRAGTDPVADEEENERALIEVVEYIRMGALLLREEFLCGRLSNPEEFPGEC
jgi:uncharacterized protein YgfB (UPF0149 family)